MHPSEPFPHFVDDVLGYLHEALPGRATGDGVHLHDDLLEDLSRAALETHTRALAGFCRRLSQISPEGLAPAEQIDHRVVGAALDGYLFELERVRSWDRSPLFYAQVVSRALASLTYQSSISESDRARRLLSRLRQVPRLTKSCQDNVREPAGILVKLGLEAWRGLRTFLERDLPREFGALDDLHLLGDLADATNEATEAISACLEHFEAVAPKAKASFRLGADVIEHSVRVVEGLGVSAEKLVELGLVWLSQAQEQFRETAATLGKGEPQDVWRQARADHAPEPRVLAGAASLLEELQGHLNKQTLVAASEQPILLRPAPDFDRWNRMSVWLPGPFEARPGRARLAVAMPDSSWPAERLEEYRLDLATPVQRTLLAREGAPGRLTQMAAAALLESKVRKSTLLASRTFVDGWAHYSEAALIDQGFRRQDAATRLAQQAETLVCLARLVIAIRLHADDMSVEQGVRFFREEAYLEEATARREAERCVFDPGSMFQAVGRRLLQRLRGEYLEQQGERTSIRAFHDAVLRQGSVPIWAHRRLLVNDHGPVTFD